MNTLSVSKISPIFYYWVKVCKVNYPKSVYITDLKYHHNYITCSDVCGNHFVYSTSIIVFIKLYTNKFCYLISKFFFIANHQWIMRYIIGSKCFYMCVHKFSAVHGTYGSLSLSWARWIQDTATPLLFKISLILSSHLCLSLPSSTFIQVFLPKLSIWFPFPHNN
jgi:hypothetical protein